MAEQRRRLFEVVWGAGTLTVFLTGTAMILAVLGLIQAGLMIPRQAWQQDWMTGGSLDLDRLLYDPTLLPEISSNPTDFQAFIDLTPPWMTLLFICLQTLSILGWAVLLSLIVMLLRRALKRGDEGWRATLSTGFALRASHRYLLVLALVGGFCTVWAANLVASLALVWAPDLDQTSIQVLGTTLENPSLSGLLLATFTLAVMAPVAEELLFRGFLWGVLERWLPRGAVLLVTTAIFALFHMSALHIIGVMFSGLMLGWLRLTSRSVWPGVAAHAMNNGLAVFFSVHPDLELGPATTNTAGILGFLACLGIAWSCWRRRDRPPLSGHGHLLYRH